MPHHRTHRRPKRSHAKRSHAKRSKAHRRSHTKRSKAQKSKAHRRHRTHKKSHKKKNPDSGYKPSVHNSMPMCVKLFKKYKLTNQAKMVKWMNHNHTDHADARGSVQSQTLQDDYKFITGCFANRKKIFQAMKSSKPMKSKSKSKSKSTKKKVKGIKGGSPFDDQGRRVDRQGRLVDGQGRLVNEDGQPVNEKGQLLAHYRLPKGPVSSFDARAQQLLLSSPFGRNNDEWIKIQREIQEMKNREREAAAACRAMRRAYATKCAHAAPLVRQESRNPLGGVLSTAATEQAAEVEADSERTDALPKAVNQLNSIYKSVLSKRGLPVD